MRAASNNKTPANNKTPGGKVSEEPSLSSGNVGRGRGSIKRHRSESEKPETSSSEDSPLPGRLAIENAQNVKVDREVFPDADAVLVLPLAEQVITMATRFDKTKYRLVQYHLCSLGYSLGTSVRVATVNPLKRVKKNLGLPSRRNVADADFEEDDEDPGEGKTTDSKKIRRIYDTFGEGGLRIDAFLRMMCVALVTKQKLFATSVRR